MGRFCSLLGSSLSYFGGFNDIFLTSNQFGNGPLLPILAYYVTWLGFLGPQRTISSVGTFLLCLWCTLVWMVSKKLGVIGLSYFRAGGCTPWSFPSAWCDFIHVAEARLSVLFPRLLCSLILHVTCYFSIHRLALITAIPRKKSKS